MSYTHLSIIERSKLEILHRQGKSARDIAKERGRHHTTISRELYQNGQQRTYQAQVFQTAITDRGKEVACYSKLEAVHKVQIYFADRYSSWQRGSNENANGLLRECFPSHQPSTTKMFRLEDCS